MLINSWYFGRENLPGFFLHFGKKYELMFKSLYPYSKPRRFSVLQIHVVVVMMLAIAGLVIPLQKRKTRDRYSGSQIGPHSNYSVLFN